MQLPLAFVGLHGFNLNMDTMLEIAKRVDAFIMAQSPVHDTMRRLAKTFLELEIPFAIAGAMAANAHGHRRKQQM